MNTKRKITGPNGLTIELDRNEVYPDDPGQGTPAMVYRNKGLYDEKGGTYWCVVDTGEFFDNRGDYPLTQDEIDWLASKAIEIDTFLYSKPDDN